MAGNGFASRIWKGDAPALITDLFLTKSGRTNFECKLLAAPSRFLGRRFLWLNGMGDP